VSTGLLFDADDVVAAYLFASYSQKPLRYDRALGLVDVKGTLKGAVLFSNYNGSNVEISYYGKDTMTAGIVRCLARFIICTFDASRLTLVTSKRNKHLSEKFQRLGFRLEGIQRCYYGHRDCTRNTGVRLVMFRQRLEELAKFDQPTLEAMRKC